MALIEPWAIGSWFSIEPDQTVDRIIDLRILNADWADSLHRLVSAPMAPHLLLLQFASLLERIAPRRALPSERVHMLLDASKAFSGSVPMAQVPAAAQVGDRWYRELMTREVGITPKRWCMVERFAATARRLHPAPDRFPDHEPNYHDQAHKIREFRRMAGMTPGAYRRAKAGGDPRIFSVTNAFDEHI
jgi:hypothetical protein